MIELGDGRTTPGMFDLRATVEHAGLPRDLAGAIALDVGTFDGFWAFELERRGARVTAIDVDTIPPPDTPAIHHDRYAREVGATTTGAGFLALREHFGSRVTRLVRSVYELQPDDLPGPVDIAFCGALLQHLRDPVGALEAIRGVLAPDGLLVLLESYQEPRGTRNQPVAQFLGHRGWTLWMPTRSCLHAWLEAAGYTERTELGVTRLSSAHGQHRLVALHARS